jgi:hypothetical protein
VIANRSWLTRAAVIAAALFFAPVANAQTNTPTINGSVTITTGNTYQNILSAVAAPPAIRRSLTIQNNNTNGDNCWLFIGSGSATKATSILLSPGGSYQRYYPYVPSDVIQATCASNSDTMYADYQ